MLYAFNKGEVCTCPSRALIAEDIYDEFMSRCLDRIAKIKQGNPLDTETMIGPQVSRQQVDKIASYVDIGRNEGAEVLIGGEPARVGGEFADGYYYQPTVLLGHNQMRVFQEEIFGPVLAVTTFSDYDEAIAIANDTLYGLGPACGAAITTSPTGLAGPSRRAGCGPTATTSTPRVPRSAVTRSPASAARPTR